MTFEWANVRLITAQFTARRDEADLGMKRFEVAYPGWSPPRMEPSPDGAYPKTATPLSAPE